jgi:hypothetical protein
MVVHSPNTIAPFSTPLPPPLPPPYYPAVFKNIETKQKVKLTAIGNKNEVRVWKSVSPSPIVSSSCNCGGIFEHWCFQQKSDMSIAYSSGIENVDKRSILRELIVRTQKIGNPVGYFKTIVVAC